MDPLTSSPLFVIITLLSTYLVAFAYKNTKYILKHKVYKCLITTLNIINNVIPLNRLLWNARKPSIVKSQRKWRRTRSTRRRKMKGKHHKLTNLSNIIKFWFFYLGFCGRKMKLLIMKLPLSLSSTTMLCSWLWLSDWASTYSSPSTLPCKLLSKVVKRLMILTFFLFLSTATTSCLWGLPVVWLPSFPPVLSKRRVYEWNAREQESIISTRND